MVYNFILSIFKTDYWPLISRLKLNFILSCSFFLNSAFEKTTLGWTHLIMPLSLYFAIWASTVAYLIKVEKKCFLLFCNVSRQNSWSRRVPPSTASSSSSTWRSRCTSGSSATASGSTSRSSPATSSSTSWPPCSASQTSWCRWRRRPGTCSGRREGGEYFSGEGGG